MRVEDRYWYYKGEQRKHKLLPRYDPAQRKAKEMKAKQWKEKPSKVKRRRVKGN